MPRSSLASAATTSSSLKTGAAAGSSLKPAGGGGGGLRSSSLSPASRLKPVETTRGTLISMPGDVLFDFDRDTIRPDAEPVLQELAGLLEKSGDAPVTIGGHTDSKGSDAYNLDLSRRRAVSVRRHLETLGVSPGRLKTQGHGEARPVAPNTNPDGSDNPAGRQMNRRVEVLIGRTP